MSKLRLAVIGAGSWAVSSHLPNLLNRSDEVDFVGVSRLGAEPLEAIRARFGFAHASEDYPDILALDPEICVIASPTALHHEHAVAAMAAGAHVLVEKPVTLHAHEAWDLARQSEALGRELMLAFGWNYRPIAVGASELLASPGVGEIEHTEITMSSVTRELLTNTGAYPDAAPGTVPEQATWTDPARSGGGYGQAQLCHALGLVLELSGLSAEAVFALMGGPADAPVELHDAAAIRWSNGATGSMSGASLASGAESNRHQLQVRLVGNEGFLHLDLGTDRLVLQRHGSELLMEPTASGDGAYDCIGPVDALVDRALGRSTPNRSGADLGARVTEVLEAAYKSAAETAMINVADLSAPG